MWPLDPPVFGPQEPLGRKLSRKGKDVAAFRDDAYGNEKKVNKKTGKTTYSKSNTGQINFFGGNPFSGMDPMGLSGHEAARSFRRRRD